MKVQCTSVEDFIANVKSELNNPYYQTGVYNNVVYKNEILQPMDERNRRNSIRDLVVLRVSCIMDVGEGQYLLDVEEDCGLDYNDASQEKEGSEVCNQKVRELELFCKSRGLTIRPGVVDF